MISSDVYPLIRSRSRIPTDDVARRVEHEDRVIRHRIDEKLEPAFGFLQSGGRRGKLSGPIGDTGFQALVERQQPGFKGLALADVVIDTGYPARHDRSHPW